MIFTTNKVWPIYDFESPGWIEDVPLNKGRFGHGCASLPNGVVLVAGGMNGIHYLGSVEIYDGSSWKYGRIFSAWL